MAAAAAAQILAFNAAGAASNVRHHGVLEEALREREHVRSFWHPQWKELALFFLPDRRGFLRQQREGEDTRDTIYGSIAELSRRGLSSGTATMLRPPGRMWFKAKPRNELLSGDESVRLWCDAVTRITYGHLYNPAANFEKQAAECDADVVTFGTGVMRPVWNRKGRHLEFRSSPMHQVVLGTNSSGQVDKAHIFWDLTIRQLIQMFGEERLPETVKSKLGSQNPNLNEPVEVVHACVPSEDYARLGGKRSAFAYSSLWIAVQDKHLLDEGGYYEFPYVTPRWDTATGEVYGRSPAMVALRDARLADEITRSIIDAAETALQPPMIAPVQAIRGTINLRPRGVTMYDPTGLMNMPAGTLPLQAIQMGEQPQKMLELLQVIEDRIGAAFFRDILELPKANEGDLTATEINARLDQYLRQAAPIFSRLEASYNAGIVNRVFGILLREGEYPDPPEVLQGQDIEFEYESPIKAARDKAEAMKIVEGLQMSLQFAEARPDILDNFDWDVVTRYLAMRADIPQAIMAPIETMVQQRQQKAKEMQMAKMAELAKTAGPAVAQMTAAGAKAKDSGMLGSNTPFPIDPSHVQDLLQGVDWQDMTGGGGAGGGAGGGNA